jgi:hypothetical protein
VFPADAARPRLENPMKYCPKCRSEFENEALSSCPACDSLLVGSVREMETFGRQILFGASNRLDAEYLIAALSTHDIKAWIDEKGFFEAGPHAVVVKAADVERAKALLDETGLEDDGEDAPPEGAAGEQCPSCEGTGELVTVAKFESAIVANELKTHLEMNGITAFLENEHAAQVMPVGGAAIPVIVKVPASQMAKVAALLNLKQDALKPPEQPVQPRYGCGIMIIVFVFFAVPIAAALHYALNIDPVLAGAIAAVVAAAGASLVFGGSAQKDDFGEGANENGGEDKKENGSEK